MSSHARPRQVDQYIHIQYVDIYMYTHICATEAV